MRTHGDVLRELVADEQGDDPDHSPGGDPSVRAHLRFAATALAATGRRRCARALGRSPRTCPSGSRRAATSTRSTSTPGDGAIALEEHLQFGTSPGHDPSLDAGLHRRLRIGGWIRVFLHRPGARLGPAADGLAPQVLDAVGARQRELSRLILALDREAKAAARRAGGGWRSDLETQDEIGQAATVQGHVRVLVEAVTEALESAALRPPPRTGSEPPMGSSGPGVPMVTCAPGTGPARPRTTAGGTAACSTPPPRTACRR